MRTALLLLIIALFGCEGKVGPMGPPGLQGEQGEQGLVGEPSPPTSTDLIVGIWGKNTFYTNGEIREVWVFMDNQTLRGTLTIEEYNESFEKVDFEGTYQIEGQTRLNVNYTQVTYSENWSGEEERAETGPRTWNFSIEDEDTLTIVFTEGNLETYFRR